MDIALCERNLKVFAKQRHRVRASNHNNHGVKRVAPAYNGSPGALTHARAHRSRPSVRLTESHRYSTAMMMNAADDAWSHSPPPHQIAPFDPDNFVNSRFRFVVRDDVEITTTLMDEEEIPWTHVEVVLCSASGGSIDDCPICFSPPVAARVTRCGHVFCAPCILRHVETYVDRSVRCPLCFAPAKPDDLRSVQFVVSGSVAVGDVVSMSLLKRDGPRGRPCPVDSSEERVFTRLLKSRCIGDVLKREVAELEAALDNCDECPMTRAAIHASLESVRERAMSWPPGQGDDSMNLEAITAIDNDPSAADAGTDVHYFYQSSDGSPLFLHSINFRALTYEFGSSDRFPIHIQGTVLHMTSYTQTEEIRKRFRFLRHLPLSTTFVIAELNINDELSETTVDAFSEEMAAREAARLEEQRRAQALDMRLQRRKEMLQSPPINIPARRPSPVPQVDDDESFPSLMSTPTGVSRRSPIIHSAWPNRSPTLGPCLPSSPVEPTALSLEEYDGVDDVACYEEYQIPVPVTLSPPNWDAVHAQMVTRTPSSKQRQKFRPLFSNASSRGFRN